MQPTPARATMSAAAADAQRWRAIPISASEPVEQSPGLFLESGAGGIGCRGVDLGRYPQMGAGGHLEWGVPLKRHRRWVFVKAVPSKTTPSRQHVSGADRFISAVFQAASFRGGSPPAKAGIQTMHSGITTRGRFDK